MEQTQTPRKLRLALGQKSGRAYGEHCPGDVLTATVHVSASTLHRWARQGLIQRVGTRYVLTQAGYNTL